jgi:hypothetical protein
LRVFDGRTTEPVVLPPREMQGLSPEPKHVRWHMEWMARCPLREEDRVKWFSGLEEYYYYDVHPVVIVPLWSVLRALHRRLRAIDGELHERVRTVVGVTLPFELVREIASYDTDAFIATREGIARAKRAKKRKRCDEDVSADATANGAKEPIQTAGVYSSAASSSSSSSSSSDSSSSSSGK